jgi:hypothetical protein
MNTWKVTIELEGRTIEVTLKARSFSEAYIQAGLDNPNGKVIHIKKQEEEDKKRF